MLNINQVKSEMEKAIGIFVQDSSTIRTGRATPAMIENVLVSISTYEGQKMKLVELGSISTSDVRTLVFQPWDTALLREISNGIAAANIGMNPIVDGQIIRMGLPPMTVEQREDYIKLLGRKLEGARGIIRDMRARFRKTLQDAKQEKSISENEFKSDEDLLQKTTDEYMAKMEEISKKKEVEIRG